MQPVLITSASTATLTARMEKSIISRVLFLIQYAANMPNMYGTGYDCLEVVIRIHLLSHVNNAKVSQCSFVGLLHAISQRTKAHKSIFKALGSQAVVIFE